MRFRHLHGDSLPSAVVAAQLPVVTPAAPVGVTTFPGRNSIALAWGPPPVSSSAPLTGYRIEHSADGQTGWQALVANTGSSRTRFLDPNPPAGTARHYRVAALNLVGTGDWSAVVSGTVDAGRPGPIRDLRVRMQGNAVELRWTAPAMAGAPGDAITGYRVDRSMDGGATWRPVVNDTQTAATVYADTQARAGTAATYRVFARNGPTDADLSRPAGYATLTVAGAWPPWPRNLAVTPRVRRHVLTWRPVQPDGGRSVTGYRLEVARELDRPLWVEVVTLDDGAGRRHIHDLPATAAEGTAMHYRIVTLTTTRESEYSAPVTAPVRTAAGLLDFNGDRVFDRADALLLYYAHVFADVVDPDRGFATVRRRLVAQALDGGTVPNDVTLRTWFERASAPRDPAGGLDLNRNGAVDGADAQALFYAREPTLRGQLDGSAAMRRTFLNPLAPAAARADADLLELLQEIDFLSGSEAPPPPPP